MALELNNKSLGKKSESEALDIIAGSDDSMHIKPSETFAGTIVAIVVDTPGTIISILAGDKSSTEIIGAGTGMQEGFKNLDGAELSSGKFITSGKYLAGANIKSVTTGTASVTVYYKYTIDRS